MCELISEGGRRCPKHDLTAQEAEARAAARRAANRRYYVKRREAEGFRVKELPRIEDAFGGEQAAVVETVARVGEVNAEFTHAAHVLAIGAVELRSTQASSASIPGLSKVPVYRWSERDLDSLPPTVQTATKLSYAKALSALSLAEQDRFLNAKELDAELWLVGLPDAAT